MIYSVIYNSLGPLTKAPTYKDGSIRNINKHLDISILFIESGTGAAQCIGQTAGLIMREMD